MMSPWVDRLVAGFVFYLLVFIQLTLTSDGDPPAHKPAFRPVDADYNARLQERCGNPDFANPTFVAGTNQSTVERGEIESRLFGGDRVPRGRHPWAVAFIAYQIIYSGGAIISKRHILTTRDGLELFSRLTKVVHIPVMVGGVCPQDGDGCPTLDMRDVPAELGAFKKTRYSNEFPDLELGIIQLAEDLDDTMLNGTAVICLPPPEEPLPPQFIVYGWGSYEKTDFLETGNNAALRETEIPLLSPSDERYTKHAEYCDTKGVGTKRSTFCLGDMEREKHTDAGTDTGAGVLAWRVNRSMPPYLFGLTLTLPLNVSTANMTVATRTQNWAYAICYYTGVCVKKEWLKRRLTEKPPLEAQQFDVFFDPNDWEKTTTATDTDSTTTAGPDSSETTPTIGDESTSLSGTASDTSASTRPSTRPNPSHADNRVDILWEMAASLGQIVIAVFTKVLDLLHMLVKLFFGITAAN